MLCKASRQADPGLCIFQFSVLLWILCESSIKLVQPHHIPFFCMWCCNCKLGRSSTKTREHFGQKKLPWQSACHPIKQGPNNLWGGETRFPSAHLQAAAYSKITDSELTRYQTRLHRRSFTSMHKADEVPVVQLVLFYSHGARESILRSMLSVTTWYYHELQLH